MEALGTSREPATILTDSMSALQAIVQRIIQAILQSARELNAHGVPLRLQWVRATVMIWEMTQQTA